MNATTAGRTASSARLFAVQCKIGRAWVTVERFASRPAANTWLRPVIERCGGNRDGLRVKRVPA
ncbi:hypothetical protein H8A99_42065 [Bradyrhizobium sp. Arg68]|uniref:hypothetical protein n=1 Tax=Bradyrhizobium ivorense TaxID=2511166 RepID=UPI001E354458|nr:hypothetical protein [Bradyrhizobium ivorense]MCC8942825.1 hypothetical protein [Bradyrhizobium ivorense]